MRGRNAGPTIADHIFGRNRFHKFFETPAQNPGWKKSAFGRYVFLARRRDCPWDVSGDRVYRFHLPSKTRSASGIENHITWLFSPFQHLPRRNAGVRNFTRLKTLRASIFRAAARRQAGLTPGSPPSVEQGYIPVSQPIQHPPQACRHHSRRIFIYDNLSAGIDSPGG